MTKVDVFENSVNHRRSVALLVDSSDHQNKHDIPFNGDRAATALAKHWILPVQGQALVSRCKWKALPHKELTGAQSVSSGK